MRMLEAIFVHWLTPSKAVISQEGLIRHYEEKNLFLAQPQVRENRSLTSKAKSHKTFFFISISGIKYVGYCLGVPSSDTIVTNDSTQNLQVNL